MKNDFNMYFMCLYARGLQSWKAFVLHNLPSVRSNELRRNIAAR